MKSRRPRKQPPPGPAPTKIATPSPANPSVTPSADESRPGTQSKITGKTKILVFRILSLVLVPLVLLGALEGILRLAGFGYPTHFFLADRIGGTQVVRDNPQFGLRFFPPAVARTPRPVVLSRNKPPQTCRIFVFGESAAFGDPSPAFGLPRVLEVLLRNRYPGVRFEVVNVAMTAINSNVILPIARDCAGEDGDVWVIYMGNNEVVGPYGGGTVFGPQVPSLAFIRASISANATRIGQMLALLGERLSSKKSGQPSSVSLDLFLNNKVRHDDPRMEKVYAHFARNLRDILETGIKSGAKVVVSSVAVNLNDCAPFASQHRKTLSDAQKSEWDQFYRAGISAERDGKFSEALEAYGKAAKIDDEWADLHFKEARGLQASGDFSASLRHLILARDYDALRFRADTQINDILSRTCSNRVDDGIAFLDGSEVLAQHSPHGILGKEVFYEHVHLNFTGNYWLARAIAEQITGTLKPAVLRGQVPGTGGWLSEEQCSSQLALKDWDRYQTLEILRQRLEGAPFTLQLNHAEQYETIQKEIAQCKVSLSRQTLAENVQSCQQALSLNPADWVLHQKLAQLLEQSPDNTLRTRALEEWREVIARVPHYSESRYELGVLLEQTGQLKEAETQLRLALKLKKNYHANALNALGRVLADQNRLAEAVEEYEKAVQLKPNFADALANLGIALNRLGKRTEAEARLQEAMRLAPGNTNATAAFGRLLDEKGDLTAAIMRYTEILRGDPTNAAAHYYLARCLALSGRSSEAQEHYAEALRIQPEFADAHDQLGVELAKSGKEAEALKHFLEAIRIKPDSESAHKDLGIALARQRRFAEAAKEFEAALRLDPTDVTAQKYLQAARQSQGSAK